MKSLKLLIFVLFFSAHSIFGMHWPQGIKNVRGRVERPLVTLGQPVVDLGPLLTEHNFDPAQALFHVVQQPRFPAMYIHALLEFVAVDAHNENGCTPLHRAAACGNYEAVCALIGRGATIDIQDNKGETPLYNAVMMYDNWRIVAELLNRGASVHTQNVQGQIPLHIAANRGGYRAVRLLLEHGAPVDAQDYKQWTPLHYAAYNGDKKVAEELLAQGADVNKVIEEARVTAEYIARHMSTVNIDGEDAEAKEARRLRYAGFVDVLTKHCTKEMRDLVHAKYGGVRGVAALFGEIAERDCPGLVWCLLTQKGDEKDFKVVESFTVHVINEDLQTPLHVAAANGRAGVVRVLLELGARVTEKDVNEQTPLELAQAAGHQEVAAMLQAAVGAKGAAGLV